VHTLLGNARRLQEEDKGNTGATSPRINVHWVHTLLGNARRLQEEDKGNTGATSPRINVHWVHTRQGDARQPLRSNFATGWDVRKPSLRINVH
jgi:hypothetical protein